MTKAKAESLRAAIEQAAVSLKDESALSAPELFPVWEVGETYAAGDRVRYDGILYKCLQGHTAQTDWAPTAAASLWAKVLIEDPETIPEWEQPESTNGYTKGDKVTHNGKTWESLVDSNVWEPGATGTESLWVEITEE